MQQGAQSSVSMLIDLQSDKQVIKKIYTVKQDYNNEISALACVRFGNHPYIVKPICADPLRMIIVLEWGGEGDLTQWNLFKDERIPYYYDDIVKIAAQIISSVAGSHRRGILHGDIKPENFVINIPKKEIKLIDYGLSARIGDYRTMTQGTPQTMAPEVAFSDFFENRLQVDSTTKYNKYNLLENHSGFDSKGKDSPQFIREAMDWWSVGVTLHYIFAKYFDDMSASSSTSLNLSRFSSFTNRADSSDEDEGRTDNTDEDTRSASEGSSESNYSDDLYFPYKVVWHDNGLDIIDFSHRPYPAEFSTDLIDLVELLMAWDPKKRDFRGKKLLQLVNHPVFKHINWYEIDPQIQNF